MGSWDGVGEVRGASCVGENNTSYRFTMYCERAQATLGEINIFFKLFENTL